MSFGKRKVEQPRWLEDDEIDQVLTDRGLDNPIKPGLSLFELASGGVLVIAAFAGTLYFMGFTLGGEVSQPAGPVTATGSEPKPVARAYEKDPDFPAIEITGTEVIFDMVTTATGFDAVDSELHEQCMKSVDAGVARRAEAIGSAVMSTEKGAEFVACTMRMYKSRFCQPFYKKRLVKRLNEFVRAGKMRAAYLQHNKNVVNEELNQYGLQLADETNSNVKSQKLPPVIPGVLGDQIYELSDQGLLTQSDFGWMSSGPKEMKAFFAEGSQTACG